jgi:hypothetical protein
LLRIADSLRSSSAAMLDTDEPAFANSRNRRTASFDQVGLRAGVKGPRDRRDASDELTSHLHFIVGMANSA